jgi:1-acyl-sn-glycerol-3-phosphate acyltransferase
VIKYLRLPIQLLWRFWFYIHGALVVVVFYPAYFILLQRKSWFPRVFGLYKACARIMLFNSGICTRVTGHALPPEGQPFVICANHASYLDIVTTYIAVPRYFHFIGKAELRNIPLFGHFFREMNIPVDRGSVISSHRAYTRSMEDLDAGVNIAIFPEGGIPETAPRLKPFKNGAFKLAIEKQVPIVPVIFLDNHNLMPCNILRRMHAGRPGRSRILVLPHVDTKGKTSGDMDALKKRVYQQMDERLRGHGVYD